MSQWARPNRCSRLPIDGSFRETGKRLIADGGHESEQADEEGDNENDEAEAESNATKNASDPDGEIDAEEGDVPTASHGNVEITEPGEAEPADPKWEEPDIENVEDIPEVTGPKTRPADSDQIDSSAGETSTGTADGGSAAGAGGSGGQEGGSDPTTGMPNTARSPARSRLKQGGADGYIVGLELCARLPEDIRLPEEAADLVPVALEAELEENVRQFAGDQFDNPTPHVETLDFVDTNGEIWLRLRLGIPPEAFADLDPDEIREHALQELEGMF